MPNFKDISLAILVQLAFNTHKIYVSHDSDHTQFLYTL